jgi:hypothetical protein
MIPLKDVTHFLVHTNKMNIPRIAGLSAIAVTTVSTLALVNVQLQLYKTREEAKIRHMICEKELDIDTRRYQLNIRILDHDKDRLDHDKDRLDHDKDRLHHDKDRLHHDKDRREFDRDDLE